MKTIIPLISALVVFCSASITVFAATVPLQTGQTTCFKPDGSAFPCAGTGQDGELQKGTPWPDPRFTDNGDGTITDNLTGLIWAQNMKSPGFIDGFAALNCTKSGLQVTWQEALDHVKCINTFSYLGFSDWRLPTAVELASVVNYGVADQRAGLVSAGFISFGFSYWSATTRVDSATEAYALNRLGGNITTIYKGYNDTIYAWPVRGNQ